jgi:nitroreductase
MEASVTGGQRFGPTDIDDVLTTTRTVRRRLDLARPVERAVVERCIELALQAPNGSNQQTWRWILVDDPDVRRKLVDIYTGAMDDYINRHRDRPPPPRPAAAPSPAQQRMTESVFWLRQHFHEVPVLVVPTVVGRTDGKPIFDQASRWGSIIPAVWSFMLALRSRGLGSAWTTLHLLREREAAELLGVPYDRYMQAGLFPVAYTLGTDFKPASRMPAADVIGWNGFPAV